MQLVFHLESGNSRSVAAKNLTIVPIREGERQMRLKPPPLPEDTYSDSISSRRVVGTGTTACDFAQLVPLTNKHIDDRQQAARRISIWHYDCGRVPVVLNPGIFLNAEE